MWDRIRNEPALVSGLVLAVVNLTVVFGLWTPTVEQLAGIDTLLAAVLALFTRQSVYSPASYDVLAGELADQ